MDLVNVVRPIDQQAAPDHDCQDREVDPVHPADGEGVFGDYLFHAALLQAKLVRKPLRRVA
jgi:hypothetical protein